MMPGLSFEVLGGLTAHRNWPIRPTTADITNRNSSWAKCALHEFRKMRAEVLYLVDYRDLVSMLVVLLEKAASKIWRRDD